MPGKIYLKTKPLAKHTLGTFFLLIVVGPTQPAQMSLYAPQKPVFCPQ
jgi:hypothetical protein